MFHRVFLVLSLLSVTTGYKFGTTNHAAIKSLLISNQRVYSSKPPANIKGYGNVKGSETDAKEEAKLPEKSKVIRSILWATTPWIFNSFEVIYRYAII